MIRKAAGLSKPTLILEQDGDTIKETSKAMKTTVLTLTAGGEPVEHKDGGVRRGCGALPSGARIVSCCTRLAHVHVSTGVNLRQGNPIISQAEWDGSTWLVRMQPQSAKSKVKSVTKRIQLESDGRLVRAGGVRGVGTGALHHRVTRVGCQ